MGWRSKNVWLIRAAGLAGMVLLLLCSTDAFAQASASDASINNVLDQIVKTFRDAAGGWSGTLRSYAFRLFGLLVTIDVAWSFMALALKQADISEWVAELVNRILYIGFFLWLLSSSNDWAARIVSSFQQAGASAVGSQGVSPSNVFERGLVMATTITSTMSLGALKDSVLLGFGALVVLIVYALIAAFMILALVESYIVVSAGVILLGFGGSRWTKEYAIKVIQYTMSVGAKLFVLQLIVGLGDSMVKQWLGQFGEMNTARMFALLGCSIVLLALTKSIPDIVQGLIAGTHVGNGAALTGAVASVGYSMTAAAALMAGGGTAAGGAFKLAREQVAAGGQGGGALSVAGHAVRNLASAVAGDVGARLSGRNHHGYMPWRMAESMSEQAKDLKMQREKPSVERANSPEKAENKAPQSNEIRPA